jgi:hypothetical protein
MTTVPVTMLVLLDSNTGYGYEDSKTPPLTAKDQVEVEAKNKHIKDRVQYESN